MRRHSFVLPLLLTLLLPACGSDDATTGAAGGSTTIPPTLTAVSPTLLYRGRPATLQIQGAGTDFDDSTVATLTGITVLSHRAAAPGSLQLEVFVPSDLAASSSDVDVGGIALKNAIVIDDPVVIDGAIPRANAGASLSLHLHNRDAANPLSDTNLHVTGAAGITFEVTRVTPTDATVIANLAPMAAAGARDVVVTLGDDGADESKALRTVLKDAFLVDPLVTSPITVDSGIDLTVPSGAEGGFLVAAGQGKKLLDLRVTSSVRADGTTILPRLALLDPTLGLAQPLGVIDGDELLLIANGPGDPMLFVGPADFGSVTLTRFHVILHAVDATTAIEVEPNEAIANATALTLPFAATGTLSSQTDKDVFVFTVTTGGTLVLRTPSTALDATDTQLEVLDSSGAVISSNEDEDPAADDVSSFLRIPVTPGTFYARVRLGHSTSVFGAFSLLGEVR